MSGAGWSVDGIGMTFKPGVVPNTRVASAPLNLGALIEFGTEGLLRCRDTRAPGGPNRSLRQILRQIRADIQ